MTLPETMRVLGQRSFGGVEVLEELTMPLPPVEGADLLVRMEAVGINPVDAKVRSNWGGFGEFQSGEPVITGWDGAGVVVALGPEADGRFETGDPVMFAGSVARAGCQREYALVDSRLVGRRPASLRPAEAAALPLTSLTVWEGLIDGMGAKGGTEKTTMPPTMLVVGGAGGVGSNAIQILRQVAGARVIATASRPESRAHCLAMGAEAVIDHHGDVSGQLRELGLTQVAAVLHTSEPDDSIDELLELLEPFGRMVCLLPIGKPLTTGTLFARSLRLQYELMFTRPLFGVDLAHQGWILDQVAALVEAGRMRSTLSQELPWNLANLREAHRLIESRRTIGKIVLTLQT
jgi:zinc-binding alcohol dehydrogenase family protein